MVELSDLRRSKALEIGASCFCRFFTSFKKTNIVDEVADPGVNDIFVLRTNHRWIGSISKVSINAC